MNKEHRAHTICQCCGQAVIKPNLCIIKVPAKHESSAIRLETLANIHGMNVARETTKKSKYEIVPLSTDEKDLKKIAVLDYMLKSLIYLEKQAIRYR